VTPQPAFFQKRITFAEVFESHELTPEQTMVLANAKTN
jgi:hypothetical protein